MSAEDDRQQGPTDDDKAMLAFWRDGMVAQDPRFGNKALLKLVGRAMIDEDFRRRLLTDTEGVLAELPPDFLPPNLKYVVSEHTPDTLSVVLPPLRAELEKRGPEFRQQLRSRTSTSTLFFFRDDIDMGDWTDPIPGGGADRGDVGTLDGDSGGAKTLEA